ncbi:condensation domain-containing protein [Kribbella speibonae]|nr:condensation domain-containing protein [Kribbella speibonae]
MAGSTWRDITAPASPAQRKFWEVHQLDPATNADNLLAVLSVPDGVTRRGVGAAVSQLTRRHEVLRTRFVLTGDDLLQVVEVAADRMVDEVTLDGTPQHVAAAAGETELLRSTMDESFDLGRAPILRVVLVSFTRSVERFVLVVTNHSIIDGWSFGIVQHELSELLEAEQQGARKDLGPVKQFRKVVAERSLENPVIAKQHDYWVEKLAGVRPELSLPTARNKADVHREALRDVPIELRSHSWNDVMYQARRTTGASPTMLYIAVLAASLAEFSVGEVVIGNVYCNRSTEPDRGVVGLLFNVLPLRISLAGVSTIRDLIGRVRAVSLEGYAYGEVPMEEVALSLGFGRAVVGGGSPLWEVAVNVIPQRNAGPATQLPPAFVRWLWSIRDSPVMECWDGRVLEMIALAGHQPGLGGGVIRYNSEVLAAAPAALVATRIARLMLRLPTILDEPLSSEVT